MGIRKPNLSVTEARRLASVRSAASGQIGGLNDAASSQQPQRPDTATATISKSRKVTTTQDFREISATGQPALAPTVQPTTGTPSTPGQTALPETARQRATTHVTAKSHDVAKPQTARSLPPLHQSKRQKVQVFLSAALPAPGVSHIFELLCQQYSPQKALQMILRKALDEYELMLESGAFQTAPEQYAADDTTTPEVIVQTSRMIPVSVLRIARAHFDPLGLESTRAFGRKLATAALAAFFSRDVRKP
ncbi:VirC2 family conjugal transfer protein [Rhizobium binae]|uniref:VirC2 family conjugal transfer protein n=1 Tax=Rhizobium binae TaxID=1138190 RepID=UPI001C829887|nr:VirC2 family conjugal transfer protein [Rhizobium binae]MBX4971067.1 VirC2 family conjugal transfer protein [Rhizobium binae]